MAHESSTENPWLTIPASEYEAHMGDPVVDQARFLSGFLGELVEEFHPTTIALLGCATGNGLERISGRQTPNVIGIDINRDYLRIAQDRHSRHIPELALVCSDLASCEMKERSLDLIYAALILEYVDPSVVIEKCSRWLRPGGILGVVLQLPSEACEKVSDTGYKSLRRLEPFMRLLDSDELGSLTRQNNFHEIRSRAQRLQRGKEFFASVYRRETGPASGPTEGAGNS